MLSSKYSCTASPNSCIPLSLTLRQFVHQQTVLQNTRTTAHRTAVHTAVPPPRGRTYVRAQYISTSVQQGTRAALPKECGSNKSGHNIVASFSHTQQSHQQVQPICVKSVKHYCAKSSVSHCLTRHLSHTLSHLSSRLAHTRALCVEPSRSQANSAVHKLSTTIQ